MTLTKSKYLAGLKCHKYLWTMIHAPDKIPGIDQASEHRFLEGYIIEKLAKEQFHGGITIAKDDFLKNINDTRECLSKKKPLFEAGFLTGNLSVRVDILSPAPKSAWDIIEIKSSTSVKDVHVDDVAFQRYCLEASGIRVRSCFVMHVNNEYVREGILEPGRLLVKEDITQPVSKRLPDMEKMIPGILKMLEADCPKIDIGSYCSSPYECPLTEYCWAILPENNVFDLYRGGTKAFDLYFKGILAIKDIPASFSFTERQAIQWDCAKTGMVHTDKTEMHKFLKSLHYPLGYLDFETFNMAIPQYDHISPYQQIPFQFSLHTVISPLDKPVHHSFIAKGTDDPRKAFLHALRECIPETGSIIVYNKTFEISVLSNLAELYPDMKEWISSVINRVVDLLAPFQAYHYYNSLQQGSASLKSVLPAVTGKDYSHLEISDGMTASLSYIYMAFGEIYGKHASEMEKKIIRKNLEAYCGLDTEGMVWIVQELEKMAKS